MFRMARKSLAERRDDQGNLNRAHRRSHASEPTITASFEQLLDDLDKWPRRRLRACIWKRWRLPRTRIRKLKQLGIRPEEAYSHGNSRKGPWRMAKSLAISMAMPNEWLDDLGPFSLSKRWTELAPLRRTAQSQSTRADPHARWCGRIPQQCGPYPDRFVLLRLV